MSSSAQMAKLAASRRTPDKIKMPPREVIRIKRRCKLCGRGASGVSQVRHLSHLFPEHGQRWPHSGRQEGELVSYCFSRSSKRRCAMRLDYRQLEQRHRSEAPPPASPGALDDDLVADARAGLTPADMVERKLLHLLGGQSWRVVLHGGRHRVRGYTNAGTSALSDSPTGQTPHPGGTGYASNSAR